MRILILPLVIVLLCSSGIGFSQATCATAIPITTCTSTAISVTTGTPSASCSGITASRRYTWFQFTAGPTCPAISFNVSTGGATEVAMFANCAAATPVPGAVACFASGAGVWSPSAALSNGTTYFLRVWTNSLTGNIDACNVSEGANVLDISGGCSTFPIVSNGVPTGTCATGGQKKVTWLKFVADATCPMLSIDNSISTAVTGGAVANEVSLYSGCGNAGATLNPIAAATTCVANGSVLWAPPAGTVIPGNTYYLRVWTNTTNSGGNLSICNVVNTAQELTLDQNCNDIDLSYATSGGTVSSIANCPGTVASPGGNRRISWVKFRTTSANQCVTLTVTNPDIKTEMALYSRTANCGGAVVAGTSLCLTDGLGVWSAGPGFPTNGYAPNTDYYLRIFTDIPADGSLKQITLCGTQKAQAVNDRCSSADVFNYSPRPYTNACAHYDGNPNEGLVSNATDAAKICAFSLQNTVWYKFKVRTGGSRATVTISNIDCDSYNNSEQLLQMGLLTGTCNSFNPAINPGPVATGTPAAFPTNNTVMSPTSCLAASGTGPFNLYTSPSVIKDQIIYLAIDGYSGANCKFTLNASDNIQPIPIHLKYFTAWKLKTANLVRWVTSWQHNNAYFEIERSVDGTYFEPIGRVQGVESVTDKLYDFEDKFPPAVAYYRLKQVDIDGKYEFSDVIQLIRDENIKFSVSAMPNPIQNTARIAISTANSGNVSMRVVDAAGRQLMTDIIPCVKGNNVIGKDFSRLPSGTYYIAISQGEQRAVKTFVKQ